MALVVLIKSLTLLLLVKTVRFYCRISCAGSTHLPVGRPLCRYHLAESCAYRLNPNASVSLTTFVFNGQPIMSVFNSLKKTRRPATADR